MYPKKYHPYYVVIRNLVSMCEALELLFERRLY